MPARLVIAVTWFSRQSNPVRMSLRRCGNTEWLYNAGRTREKSMCGICGIVNFNATEPVDRRLVERMTHVQSHRGPDDDGYFIQDNVGLGHRRLSIIDLSGGKQPIFNEDGSVVVVFNGEIYNYGDLTPDLISLGHQFNTKSDTETIVHAYEQYGDECMRLFRGMFAFAVWDRRHRRLLLARDRMGIKPVYYHAGQDFFVFASEIKSLLQDPRVPREVDHQAADLYLALRYVPGPRTMFKNIFKLPPGHFIVVDQNGFRIQKYWDLADLAGDSTVAAVYDRRQCRSRTIAGGHRPPLQRERELIAQFDHLLEESVRL